MCVCVYSYIYRERKRENVRVCVLFLLARGNNVLEVAFDGMIALIRKEKYGKGVAGKDMFGLAESSFLSDTKQSPRYKIKVIGDEFIKVRTAMQMPDKLLNAECAGVCQIFLPACTHIQR
jgi:hypothetical protein